jgi:hypothetical protein
MMLDFLADPSWDRSRSAVIGDRDTDLQFAVNLGVAGIRCGPNGLSWPQIARQLLDAPRTATVQRNTKETRIEVSVDLDAESAPEISTGLGFFDHMLEQLGKHGGFGLKLNCAGDLHIDEHHTVEDSALALGRRCARRSATSAASVATASRCRWTKPWRRRRWTCPAAPGWSSTAASRASESANCRPNWCRTSSARCATRWAPTCT